LFYLFLVAFPEQELYCSVKSSNPSAPELRVRAATAATAATLQASVVVPACRAAGTSAVGPGTAPRRDGGMAVAAAS
jgi:hypothetical protein